MIRLAHKLFSFIDDLPECLEEKSISRKKNQFHQENLIRMKLLLVFALIHLATGNYRVALN